MKTVKIILIIALAVLVAGSAVVGVLVLNSPQYALYKMAKDVEQQGIDGLSPHLTGEAKTTVDNIQAITKNPLLNSILNQITGNDTLSILKSNLKDVSFSLKEVQRQGSTAKVTLGFTYKETLVGDVQLDMAKTQGEWKINKLYFPNLNELHF